MKKNIILKIAGAAIAVASIIGVAAYVSNKKEEKDKLNDDNKYIKSDFGISDSGITVTPWESIYTRYIKKGLDIVLSSLGLIMLLPAFAIISVAIFIDDPGPVIFKQKRVGKNCKYFYCHKFRTMKMSTPHDVPTHQLADPDQYITKVGRVLRRTSMDEIPQCWDILRGKMSFIGPRPALWNQEDLVAERAKYGANDVMPGLTGLAQINGRDELEIAEKARIDGEYVKKLGFLTDIKCCLGTIRAVIKCDGVVEGGTGSIKKSRAIEPVKSEDVGFDDYGYYKTFNIDKSAHKRVLITGAGSYIGESFKSYCEEHYSNIECTTIDMLDGSWREHPFTDEIGKPYDTVFHVAGIAHADVENVDDATKEKYYAVNTDLAIEVCRKAKEAGVNQFIFMSSMIVYGGQEYIDRNTMPSPANFYGDSKWQGDVGVRKLERSNFHVAVLRPPMIYGKGSKGNYQVLSRIAKKTPVFPEVNNCRSMLYVENLCEFVAQLSLAQVGGIYFPQNAEYTQTSKMVKTIGDVAGRRVRLIKALSPAVDLVACIPVTKIKGLTEKAFRSSYYDQNLSHYDGLDYQRISLEESIRRTETE